MSSHCNVSIRCHLSERANAVAVVEPLDETITLGGRPYHPMDIERSVERSHGKIREW